MSGGRGFDEPELGCSPSIPPIPALVHARIACGHCGVIDPKPSMSVHCVCPHAWLRCRLGPAALDMADRIGLCWYLDNDWRQRPQPPSAVEDLRKLLEVPQMGHLRPTAYVSAHSRSP